MPSLSGSWTGTRTRLRGAMRVLSPSLAVGLCTLFGLHAALPLHDLLGAVVPAPTLPVVIVRTQGPLADAAYRAAVAGADGVWIALPPGDPRLGDAQPDPGTLEAGADGVIRGVQGRRLPLPEALRGLRQVDEASLASIDLDGRDSVVVSADPSIGLRVNVPGSSLPVDRGQVLAVALATARTDGWLLVLPFWLAPLVTAGVSLVASARAWRLLPVRAIAESAVLAAAVIPVAVAARAFGVDLPVGGLVAAPLLPAFARATFAVTDALALLDRLVLWVGPSALDHDVASDLDSRAHQLAAWLPDAHVRADRSARPEVQKDEHLEVVHERGRVVGAFIVRAPGGLDDQARRFVRAFARVAPYVDPVGIVDVDDPHAVRVGLAREVVIRALARARRWEALLTHTEGKFGVFDPAGNLVAGSQPVAELIRGSSGPPLLRLLVALDVDAPAEIARGVLADGVTGRVGTRMADILLHPILDGTDCVGTFVQVIDRAVVQVAAAERRSPKLRLSPSVGR